MQEECKVFYTTLISVEITKNSNFVLPLIDVQIDPESIYMLIKNLCFLVFEIA